MNQSEVEAIILRSMNDLLQYDMDLIEIDDESEVIESIPDKNELERKLHEVCINHRLAVYIEKYIREIDSSYHVDIEYNRYYKNEKYVHTRYFIGSLRPDIVIHKRMNQSGIQHLLVIEAKKDKTDYKDESKIKALMTDDNYQYLYGARIRYNSVINSQIDFYYHTNNSIQNKTLIINP